MSLYDASQHLPEEYTSQTWEVIGREMQRILDSECPNDLRTSIISVAGLQNIKQLHPAIKSTAQQYENDSVRLAAIASLGHYAFNPDKPLLQSIANSNSKFSYAAKSALQQF